MRRAAALLLGLVAGGCEEPYYGDVRVAQYRPDDPRVVGPNAFQLRPPPFAAESPRPVFVIRSGPALFQRSYQDWVSPPPQPAAAAPVVVAPVVVAPAPPVAAPDMPEGLAPVGLAPLAVAPLGVAPLGIVMQELLAPDADASPMPPLMPPPMPPPSGAAAAGLPPIAGPVGAR